MVLVEPRHKLPPRKSFLRRHSFSVSDRSVPECADPSLYPCVDIPVQTNFGSLYGSSMAVLFDF